MTCHARVGAGQTGERGFFYAGVAVTTIDAVIADVMFMTERDRLIERNIDVG